MTSQEQATLAKIAGELEGVAWIMTNSKEVSYYKVVEILEKNAKILAGYAGLEDK